MSSGGRSCYVTPVLRNEALSPTCRLIVLERPRAFPDASPGQFVLIRVSDSTVPLLRRPFSIMDLTGSELSLLVKVVGRGSAILAARREGETIDLMGPLGGTSFPEPEEGSAVFVAGGTGLAPLHFAVRLWKRKDLLEDSHLVYGAAGGDELLECICGTGFGEVRFATIDGSSGHRGDAVSLCDKLIREGSLPTSHLYSCGPRGMIQALCGGTGELFPLHHTSLESVMACGVGACRGCTVPVRAGGDIAYRAVCSDGTVFAAREIAWEEWSD